MLCQDIMKRDVRYVSRDDTIATAAKLMRDDNIGFLPVCDADNRPVGTITDRDIAVRAVANQRTSDARVAEVMSQEVISCSPQDDLRRAEQLMGEGHKSRIMCVEDGKLVGVISLSDIAEKEESHRATSTTMRRVSEREKRQARQD